MVKFAIYNLATKSGNIFEVESTNPVAAVQGALEALFGTIPIWSNADSYRALKSNLASNGIVLSDYTRI